MSEKSAPGGKWANPALLEALAMGFHTVAKGEGLTKEAKDAVILKIHAYGFTDITWEAVRCILVSMVKTMVPSTDQYSLIIEELHALGHTMTASALKCAFHIFPSAFPTSASPALSFPPLPTYTPRSSDLSVFSCLKLSSSLPFSLQSPPLAYLITTCLTLPFSYLPLPIKMAPVTVWNDEARSDLLVALLSVIKPSKEDWDRVLPIVHAKGYVYNANAVTQHIQKLQRKELNAGDGGDGEASASATPKKAGKKAATPKKAGTPATPRKRKTPAKSKAKVEEANEDDEDDEKEAPPPKKPCTPSRPSMKDEFHEDTKDTKTTVAKFVPINAEI
ncbi:hypothetical protein CTAM01_02318 [Colletotrichum tamarilloi]|uniref:Uncharacterized protein n=1 Tax=Colletotrichum tamarilloi TaxID=1209934 RepID=A0ABQ9RNN0_9PEZI|nr:uncharacterized protein CTAM01_02318 [Colletotrichum tamarilloi]KAK1508532.1 hypothetical protein CTAM01_02318 [Colletotrichum tamarilloi]